MAQIREDEVVWSSNDHTAKSDRDLTISFQHGDAKAFDAIYERYIRLVSYICTRALTDSADVQDAIQETFLRVYSRLPQFNGKYHLRSWIAVIAGNVCRDTIRAKRRAARNVTLGENELQLLADDAADPQKALQDAATRGRVRSIVASMAPHYRSALIVRHVEDVSSGELARMMGITEGQARALAHRARRAFKQSWFSSRVSMLLCLRLMARWRQVPSDGGARASSSVVGVGDAAFSSTQAALACSTAASQCAAAALERFTAVFAAAAVGMAAPSLAVVSSLETSAVVSHAAPPAAILAARQSQGMWAQELAGGSTARTNAGRAERDGGGRTDLAQAEEASTVSADTDRAPTEPAVSKPDGTEVPEASAASEPDAGATVPAEPSPEPAGASEAPPAPAEPDSEAAGTDPTDTDEPDPAPPPEEPADDAATESAPEAAGPAAASPAAGVTETGSTEMAAAGAAVTEPAAESDSGDPPA